VIAGFTHSGCVVGMTIEGGGGSVGGGSVGGGSSVDGGAVVVVRRVVVVVDAIVGNGTIDVTSVGAGPRSSMTVVVVLEGAVPPVVTAAVVVDVDERPATSSSPARGTSM
jgi:hypothetical protein